MYWDNTIYPRAQGVNSLLLRTENGDKPAHTNRNKHVIIAPKLRFDAIITCLLRAVFAGKSIGQNCQEILSYLSYLILSWCRQAAKIKPVLLLSRSLGTKSSEIWIKQQNLIQENMFVYDVCKMAGCDMFISKLFINHCVTTEKVPAKYRSLKMAEASLGKWSIFGDCGGIAWTKQWLNVHMGNKSA